jgi:PhnB protein
MPRREGFHTVTPYMVLRDAAAAIEFYKRAFSAVETFRMDMPDGKIRHAEIRIGDSHIMLVDEPEEYPDMRSVQAYGGSPVQIFLYVDDVDSLVAQAAAAGAKVIMEISDRDYGRAGGVKDPFGLTWWVTSHKEAAGEDVTSVA